MRNFKIFLGLFIFLLLASCSEKEPYEHKIIYEEPENTKTRYYAEFSRGLYEAMRNPDVAEFLITKAKDKIDYDYNVLYSTVANEMIKGKPLHSYIFKKTYYGDKSITSEKLIEKYPLLNLYFYNIEKYKERDCFTAYVVMNERETALEIDFTGSYSTNKKELLQNPPEGFALVIGDNERFSAKKTEVTTKSNEISYNEILSKKKNKENFILNGFEYKYRDLIYVGSTENIQNNTIKTKGRKSSKLKHRMIKLHYSKFSSVSAYKLEYILI